MNLTFKKQISLAIALLCFAMAARPATPPNSAPIIDYLFNVMHGKDALVRAMLTRTSGEPELRSIVEGAAETFNIDEFSSLLSKDLSSALSPDEVSQCLAFITSPDGAALMVASQNAASASEIPQQISLLTTEQQNSVRGFFASSCFSKTIAFLGSPAAHEISHSYGRGLVCTYAEHTSPDMLNTLRSHGKCRSQ